MTRLLAARDEAVSLALWGVGLAWVATTLPPLTLLHRRFSLEQLDRLTRVYTRGQVALTGCRWRAEVDPAVDPSQPYVFVQNHVNLLDHCTAYDATPHLKTGIELASHFSIPFYGPFMKARGTIGIDPEDPAHLFFLRRRMREELDAGRSLIAFPEGTRTRTGRVGPFHPGVFAVARHLKASVVPIALTGMYDVVHTGSRRFRPCQEVVVRVMAPRPTRDVARADLPAFVDQIQADIAAHVDAWLDDPRRRSRP